MGFRRRIIYFLVHTLKISNKEARLLIGSGKVMTGDRVLKTNELIADHEEIKVNGRQIRKAFTRRIVLLNKPPGYISTLNSRIENGLAPLLKNCEGLSIAGRLDKDSEGLLVLSNDGQWVEQLIHPKNNKEKEYEVRLDKEPDKSFFARIREGIQLVDFKTRPCLCESLDAYKIRIILTEGKNRQIRRMCAALGFQVLELRRTRIQDFHLEDLLPGESKEITDANNQI